jgi:hypothetical protein
MVMHINIAVPNRVSLFHSWANRGRDLFRFLRHWKTIEEMFDMFEHGSDLLRFAVL